MSKFPISLDNVHSAIQEKGHRWHPAQTSMAQLEHEDALKRLGYTPHSDEPSLDERERRSAANAVSASAPSASATDQAAGSTSTALPADSTAAPAGVAAPGTSATAAGAPAAGAGPGVVDWRNFQGYNWVTPIQDQGACGSCVAFSSCAAVESAMRIGTSNPNLAIQLSEAQLFYCVARSQGRTCGGTTGGWWPASALPAFQYPGIADAACYPYTAGDQNCTNLCANWQQRVTNITGWHSLTSVADMKAWLATRGPLVTCFSVYDDFMYYAGGVYQHSTGNLDGGHAVCVIGYDDTQGAWIVKNSWGTGWGMAGFFLIGYGQCGIDAQMWAVEGVASGAPVIARNQNGNLEVFVRGTPDKALWHCWQSSSGASSYSGWSSLGGTITTDPAVITNAQGQVQVFARGTGGTIATIWQNSPSGSWAGWAGLDGATTTIASKPVVINNSAGGVDLFARGTDGALWHTTQSAPGTSWPALTSLGSTITGQPAVASNADGRLEVFARGSDGALWHISQTAPGGGWSAWASLGNLLGGDPIVGRNADGRLEVFARGTDSALWHIYQNTPGSSSWSGWGSLAGQLLGRPAIATNADGRLELFAIYGDRAVWHNYQVAPNSGWSGWGSLGGVAASDPSVLANADGRLEIFVRGTDGAIYHDYQTAPNGGWSGWSSLGIE
ncbi:MAG TPA: C1 family peptidase [Streptosporangiaceae bacterium]|nr:C1 family peptidase [Streptosporangiaceae bacterium]